MFLFAFCLFGMFSAADSRRILNEDEVENLLIFLLSHSSLCVQVAAAHAVASMAENLVSRDAFGKLGWDFLHCFFNVRC